MQPAVRSVAFVRNIMVGRRGLTRDVLLDIFKSAGAEDTQSYITTGNFAFTADRAAVAQVAARIESAIEAVLGHREEAFIRSVDELRRLDQSLPFSNEPVDLVRAVTFVPDGNTWTDELPYTSRRGDVRIIGASGPNIFSSVLPVGGVAQSPIGLIEKALKVRATTRNWNTVERIIQAEALR